ncbi:MAG: ATPase AAA [Patescibacteria group bacterium]|nr:MAG: ATPase AAA [Patescibacteria group bacterium]
MSTLATLLRPTSLEEYLGQTHLLGENKPLKIASEKGHIFSMIFWGPPGVGKTTLAQILAKQNGRDFYDLSAVSAKKTDIKDIVDQTKSQRMLTQTYKSPILFLDEIHRFNKAQQDFLLPYVEDGTLILIGATTENPSFEVISALLSRCKVFILNPLSSEEINQVIDKALKYLHVPLKKMSAETREWLVQYSNGDARKIISLIDNTVTLYKTVTLESFKNTLQSNQLSYDKKGEEHYNTISAFIKSMRASNVDAALYYLARMVESGEDPKFIARRMVIFASEDIGLAAPTALVVANAVFEAVTHIGYPEAQINLAHGVAYLCKCEKNRSAYDAYFAALRDVQAFGSLPIPLHLRNAPTQLMKNAGYGKNYEMYPEKTKSLLPEKLKHKKYLPLKQ